MKRLHFENAALRHFLAVVEAGTIVGAANRLDVASSAVSRHIASLEQLLQRRLFERHPKGMRVTDVGQILADHARLVEADAARTCADIARVSGDRAQTIEIAGAYGFAACELPRRFATFQTHHPHVRFSFTAVEARSVVERVRTAQADIGVTYTHGGERDVQVLFTQPIELVAVMREDHPLSHHERLDLGQLSLFPLALPETGGTLRKVLDIASSLRNLDLVPALSTNHQSSLLHYVAMSSAVTVAARQTVSELYAGLPLICRPLDDPLLNAGRLQFMVHATRPLSELAEAFVRYLTLAARMGENQDAAPSN